VKYLRALFIFGLLVSACDDDEEKSSDAGGEPSADAGREPSASDAGGDAPMMTGAPYNECKVDSDCGWGEIKREILKKSDCVCLYGCPYIPLAKSTVTRRAAQHGDLCDPRKDGQGQLCGVDDCAQPPPIVCDDGACAARAGAR
jgi:hypothetical protein